MGAVGKYWFDPSSKKVLAVIDRLAPFILIILSVAIILPGLGEGSLRDWDEAIYAQVSREIIQSADWINLHHGYEPYFEKPPLLMWITSIFYQLFGVDELWARMTSALSGILLVYVTYLSGRAIYGNRTGFMAGLILLSSYGFVYQARNGTTNIPLSLFVFTGIFAYLRLRNDNQKWWFLILGSCALAFMVKFWAGLALPAVLVIILLVEGKISETLHSKHFWMGLLLAGIIVIPWHLLVYLQNGQAFIDGYITRNLLQRSLTTLDGHYGSSLFYVDVLRQSFSPWFFLIPFALVPGIREIIDQQRKSNILIAVILLIIGFYTFVVNTKIDIYILPVFPALSILIAHFFILASSTSLSEEFLYLISAALVATTIAQNRLLILCIFIGFGFVFVLRKGFLPMERIPQIITGLIFSAFVLVGAIGYVQGNYRLGIWSVYKLPDSPVSQIATLAGQAIPSPADPLIGFDLEEKNQEPYTRVEGPAAKYYSNRPMSIAKSWEQLEELMAERESGEILVAEKYISRLSEDFEISVIADVYPLVYASFNR